MMLMMVELPRLSEPVRTVHIYAHHHPAHHPIDHPHPVLLVLVLVLVRMGLRVGVHPHPKHLHRDVTPILVAQLQYAQPSRLWPRVGPIVIIRPSYVGV